LQKSGHRLQSLAAGLLNNPSRLLGCLLFGNMTVNVLFFAIASVLTTRIGQQVSVTAAAGAALVSFAVLVLFGEIVPKSLAYANSKAFSVAAALPAVVCVRVFGPIVYIFRFVLVEPALRLVLGPGKHPKPITTGEIKSLIEQVCKRGLLSLDENKLLGEIIELGFLKVRHVMRPRVDMAACAATASYQKAVEIMQRNHLTKLPVYAGKMDNIVGLVHLRQLLLRPGTPVDKLVQQVHFVPEQKTVESLLEFFRTTHSDIAIVVDEYGGIAGSVRLEDIAEELLGPIEPPCGIEPIELIGPFEYRLAGGLAVREWAEVFGIEASESRFSTIGGLVTSLLGKIPKSGDAAYWNNLKFTVERMHKHRVETVILTVGPMPRNGQ